MPFQLHTPTRGDARTAEKHSENQLAHVNGFRETVDDQTVEKHSESHFDSARPVDENTTEEQLSFLTESAKRKSGSRAPMSNANIYLSDGRSKSKRNCDVIGHASGPQDRVGERDQHAALIGSGAGNRGHHQPREGKAVSAGTSGRQSSTHHDNKQRIQRQFGGNIFSRLRG